MKLTKKLQVEITAMMNDYWDSYFRGDIAHWREYLVDDYRNIGGTEEEIWNSKKEILDYTFRVIDQMVGKTDIRNKKTQIIPYDPYIMVHEFMDLFIKLEDEWTYYGKFRLSSLIQHTPSGWKVLHQHGSYPDSHTEDGEAFAFDKLKEENTQLREAVKRRTIELETKNRELEIETSLERVRTVAMGMKKPDDILEICKVIFSELRLLGFSELRNSLINFWDDVNNALIDYDYSDYTGGHKANLSYSSHPVFEQFQKKIRQSKDSFAELVVDEELLESWKQRRRDSNEYEDPRLENINALYYYFYSIGVGSVGISTFSSLAIEKLNLLKRFRNVFDLAYRRYKDVENAEAQAREAQIEAAVERIRSKALAMYKSKDLHGVVITLKKELLNLNIRGVSAVSMYLEQDDGSIRGLDLSGMTDGEEEGSAFKMDVTFKLEDTDPDLWIRKIWNCNEHYFVIEADEADFERIIKWLYTIDEKEAAIAEKIIKQEGIKKAWLPTVKLEKGKLNIDVLEPPTPEIETILVKIGAAFDLAYTRFLDLQKAEAQTREAQIEVSVERVRAKALAMHKSDEIMTVVLTMRNELESLNIPGVLSTSITLRQDDGSIRLWDNTSTKQLEDGLWESTDIVFRLEENNPEFYFNRIWNTNEKYFVIEQYENDLPITVDWVRSFDSGMADTIEHYFKENDIKHCWHPGVQLSHGKLNLDSLIAPEPEMETILLKMGAAFDLAYKRFLDLKKAEAQAREAQIETALERVRSGTMAMHKSNDLLEVVKILADQLAQLDFKFDNVSFGENNQDDDFKFWIASAGEVPPLQIKVPYMENPAPKRVKEAQKKGLKFFADLLSQEENRQWSQYLIDNSELKLLPDKTKDYILNSIGFARSTVILNNINIYIGNYKAIPYTENENRLFQRFALVFEQSYTRFLDLQKAEAQAREAEIELALERIRAKTMAMQKQNDLLGVTDVFLEQLIQLGFDVETVSFSDGLSYKDWNVWLTTPAGETGRKTDKLLIPWFDHPYFNTVKTALDKYFKDGVDLNVSVFNKEDKDSFLDYLFTKTSYADFSDEAKDFFYSRSGFTWSTLYLKETWVAICKYDNRPFTEEQNIILKKFANTFGQTYTRFLDLQKAEAQAREAQIESALEKVRSKAMAMHTSEELIEVAKELRKQVGLLGTKDLETCAINLYEDSADNVRAWAGTRPTDSEGEILELDFLFPKKGIEVIEEVLKAYQSGSEELTITVEGAKLKEWLQVLRSAIPDIHAIVLEYTNLENIPEFKVWWSCAFFPGGCLMMITMSPPDDQSRSLLKRFSQVFGMAYRRFADLQKAEAQAKEAQIEAALEKVRSISLAMHKSDEIKDVVAAVMERMTDLNIEINGGVSLITFSPGSKDFHHWFSNPGQISAPLSLHLPYFDNLIFNDCVDAIEKGMELFAKVYSFEEKIEFFEYAFEHSELKNAPEDWKNWIMEQPYFGFSFAIQKNSAIFLNDYTGKLFSEEENELLKRFAKVFEQAYVRFLDLQKAEAQAREAQIEGAMEKVRSRALAMQKPEELVQVAQLLRKEMSSLGVEELETSSIYIVDDDTGVTECWYAIKDVEHPEKKLVSDYMNIQLNETAVGKQMLAFYRSNEKKISIPMQGDARKEWINYCADHSKVLVGYYGDIIPDRTYHLYKFSNGYMGAASPGEISAESWDLLQHATSVFSLAYTRFSDLQKAEAHAFKAEKDLIEIKAARKKAEDALAELRATQQQLIQSEKMASLGELTAGIAHEIQNPLNFVNNFSEVNKELTIELEEEIDKGNYIDAKAIAKNIRDNEDKINHHGKRADAIVKGMLQHSRKNSGQKEPTDINALADEYLRLAYHGMRAKDKSFNATLKTDYDESIGNINIIPQDIGRVILNLITNAFYACTERIRSVEDDKKKSDVEYYEPTVSVSTKKIGDKVEIKVADNGNGIPQNILDKIFQPFFTTKPTGQGTGLGLSLSYDIVKTHGGELQVETKENVGTEFIISIPN